MARKIIKNLRVECRYCKNYFSKILGIQHMEQDCCTPQCFLRVGIKIVTVELSTLIEKKPKKIKSLRRSRYVDSFYRSRDWLEIRYAIIKKYGRECMACGQLRGSMHVDHIKPRSKYPELELQFDNLQILCKECNYGKSDKDETDFRPVELIQKEVG